MLRLLCTSTRSYLQYRACHNASTTARFITSRAKAPKPVKPLPAIHQPIKLRSYQEECIQSVLSYLKDGHRRLGISLATGSGKTVIFTQLIDRMKPPNEKATRTLILAHRRELVEQAARHCQDAYPSKTVEIEMGNIHASGFADITVASVQSIGSGDRKLKFDPSRFKLVLVDEAHHIIASQYLEVLDHFKLKEKPTSPYGTALVGVSATFSRLDGRQLGQVIDQIVFHKDYIDMIGEKWLSEVKFTTVESSADVRKVGTSPSGDFQAGALSKAINTDEINEITVRAWKARAGGRKSTLVFCVDLDHVANLTATFRKHGFEAHFITGSTPNATRADRLTSFRNGRFPVLLNCSVFTEGTDIPNIDCVLLARPTKSRNLLVQMIGRGMRLHPGKKDCHIIDMVSSLSTGIVSTPTLFGLDPAAIIENASVTDMEVLKNRKEKESKRELEIAEKARAPSGHNQSSKINVSFTDYDSITDLLEDTTEERAVQALSQFAWISVGDDRYILSAENGDYLTIEPTSKGYTVKFHRKLPVWAKSMARSARPKIIATLEGSGHAALEQAVRAADTYASEIFQYIFIAKHQSWRRAPASKQQVDFLNRFRDEEDQLEPSDVSKGRAMAMITKLKHGARGRYKRAVAQKRSSAKLQEKEKKSQDMARREIVTTGPLSYRESEDVSTDSITASVSGFRESRSRPAESLKSFLKSPSLEEAMRRQRRNSD